MNITIKYTQTSNFKTSQLEHMYEVIQNDFKRLGIPCVSRDKLILDFFSQRAWGQCKTLGGGFFVIHINECLLGGHFKGLKNTLAHELLHTCPNCFNHGSLWKKYAKKANVLFFWKIYFQKLLIH